MPPFLLRSSAIISARPSGTPFADAGRTDVVMQ
jgi:hypothetical protein